MSSLIDNVMGQLDQQHIEAIANQLGTDPDQARNAIEHALPLIVGGLHQNASTEQGAQDLHDAATAHAGTDIGSLLGGLLGGGAGGASGGMLGGLLGGGAGSTGGGALGGLLSSGAGSAILGHIFGGNQANATQGLGQATGLGAQGSEQLLAMLAPLVLSSLGNMAQQHGLNPGALTNVLGQDVQRAQQGDGGIGGMLSSVLGSGGGSGGGGGNLGALAQMAGGLLSAFSHR